VECLDDLDDTVVGDISVVISTLPAHATPISLPSKILHQIQKPVVCSE
jgi:hypothetical protein